MKIGIVGLPNAGKSTLFNALTKSKQAQAANYPFCTIEPNIGIVEVPDSRLYKLAEISKSQKTIPAIVEFVDIAGLVKGASKGEGLGNKFLLHIKEVDAIAHVVRFFEDGDVTHINGKVDPISDAEIVNIELAFADLVEICRAKDRALRDSKSESPKEKEKSGGSMRRIELCEKIKKELEKGNAVRDLVLTEEEKNIVKSLNLLTAKPILYVLNSGERARETVKSSEAGAWSEEKTFLGKKAINICAKLESELAEFSKEEAREFLEQAGIKESGLDALIRASYEILGLITFFTTGVKESRAWTILSGIKAQQAAGVIHSDFEKAFIRAEVISFEDFAACGSEASAKENGKLRIEGKEYVVRDGDVCHFRVGV